MVAQVGPEVVKIILGRVQVRPFPPSASNARHAAQVDGASSTAAGTIPETFESRLGRRARSPLGNGFGGRAGGGGMAALVASGMEEAAHEQNHRRDRGRDSRLQAARALLAGKINARKVGRPGKRKRSAATRAKMAKAQRARRAKRGSKEASTKLRPC